MSIDDACEHAMSVVGEGGACECTVCHAHCPGRFAGCAQVVSQPGYMPALAPSWARSGDASAAPAPALPAPRPVHRAVVRDHDPARSPGLAGRPLGDVESELAAIRELVEKLLDRPDGDELASLRALLEERDAELVSMFDRFLRAHRDLAATIEAAAAAQQRASERIETVEGRLAAIDEVITNRGTMLDWLRRLG